MHRCIIRNDQTVEPDVILEKRDSLFEHLDTIHSTYRQIINQHWLSML